RERLGGADAVPEVLASKTIRPTPVAPGDGSDPWASRSFPFVALCALTRPHGRPDRFAVVPGLRVSLCSPLPVDCSRPACSRLLGVSNFEDAVADGRDGSPRGGQVAEALSAPDPLAEPREVGRL